jgi:hypothetical protein
MGFCGYLNAKEASQTRIKYISILCAALIWLTYIIGGYWYVVHYAPEKAIIKAGPWPFAHDIFMETKEHVFLMLLLLSTYLPIAASGKVAANRAARKVLLWVSGLIVPISLSMEGSGAVMAIAVKIGLLFKQSQGG